MQNPFTQKENVGKCCCRVKCYVSKRKDFQFRLEHFQDFLLLLITNNHWPSSLLVDTNDDKIWPNKNRVVCSTINYVARNNTSTIVLRWFLIYQMLTK